MPAAAAAALLLAGAGCSALDELTGDIPLAPKGETGLSPSSTPASPASMAVVADPFQMTRTRPVTLDFPPPSHIGLPVIAFSRYAGIVPVVQMKEHPSYSRGPSSGPPRMVVTGINGPIARP
jgi:hypothetical protein